MRKLSLGLLCVLCSSSVFAAPSVDTLLAQFRSASGGTAWDQIKVLEAKGELATGGLTGAFSATEDLVAGRSRSDYVLGPIKGAEGFDGQRRWAQDPGGEIRFPDSAEDRASALSQAWLTRRAWWYPKRQAASYGAVDERQLDGHTWYVVEARPEGGLPLQLWFDSQSRMLERIDLQEGRTLVSTRLSDWRAVGALKLPFATTVDRGDPQNRVVIRFEQIAANPQVAEQHYDAPQAAAKARIADASGRSEIKVEVRNNHLYADALVDGKAVRMLIDTGGVNILTPAAAERLGIQQQGELAAQGVGAQRASYGLAKADRLQLGAAQLDQPVIYVLALSGLADIEGEDLDGIIGYELFHHFAVSIDYAAGRIVLSNPEQFQAPAQATKLPFELADRIPVIQGRLDGLPVSLTVDTGSRASLTLHSPFVAKHALREKYAAVHESVIGFGVGGATRGYPVRLGELQLGELQIQHIAGDLYTGQAGAFANPDHSANLGSGLLKRFTVSFDYRNRQMYLQPNAGFNRPDTFDRSGLWLQRDGNALQITDIAPASGAEQSGLCKGQRIIAIDGESISQRHLSDWRERMRETGRTQVILQIEGLPVPVELVLSDRIATTWRK